MAEDERLDAPDKPDTLPSSLTFEPNSLTNGLFLPPGTLVISTLSTTLGDGMRDESVSNRLPGRFLSIVRPVVRMRIVVTTLHNIFRALQCVPAGMVGVRSADFLLEVEDTFVLVSREMVFLRPRFVVPGTFGPVDEDVYLIISVSDGSRNVSSNALDDGLREGHTIVSLEFRLDLRVMSQFRIEFPMLSVPLGS